MDGDDDMDKRKRPEVCVEQILKADSWASYKLRSARKAVEHISAELVQSPEPDSDLSESENEGPGYRTSRSSARHAATVIAKFCEQKKKAVSEIGFGGLLQLGLINKVNLKFTTWILSMVDLNTRSMPIGRDGRVFLRPEHIRHVIGVPSEGRKVCGLEPDNAQERIDFVRLAMGASQHITNPLKAAQTVVTKEWKGEVSTDVVDEFKIAFVVWINGRFLAPTSKHDLGSSDFWGSLYNTEDIKEFNWGAYYLDHMMEAASRLQSDLKNKAATKLITSCPLIWQVIYLDNLDLGTMSRAHIVFPRIQDFNNEATINRMIAEDSMPKQGVAGEATWGASKALRHDASCYMPNEGGQSSSAKPTLYGKESGNSKVSVESFKGPDSSPSVLRPLGARDFCEFMKQTYPDMFDSDIVQHLKLHNARCILHANVFKDSIIRENMRLAARLLDKKDKQKQAVKPRRNREDYLSAGESETETENRFMRQTKKSCMTRDTASPPKQTGISPSCMPLDRIRPIEMRDPCPNNANTAINKANMPNPSAPTLDAQDGCNKRQVATGSADCVTPTPMKLVGSISIPAYPGPPARQRLRFPFIQRNNHPGSDDAGPSEEKQEGSYPAFDLGSFSPDKECNIQAAAESEDVQVRTPRTGKAAVTTPHSPLTENVIYAECALAAKWDLSPKYLNLNATSLAAEYSDSPIIKRTVKPGRFARSPWAIGINHPTRDRELTHSFFGWVSSTTSTELERPWLVHSTPRYIEVDGTTVKKAFSCSECWGYDVFDLAIRCIKHLDRGLYTTGIIWRLIFESDLAVISADVFFIFWACTL